MNLSSLKNLQVPLLGILAMAALAGCGRDEAAGANGQGARDAVAVTVAEARSQEVRVELYSVGRLVSLNTPMLAAEIDARVVEILVDEGEPVVRGQELLRLDTTALELARYEAQAGIQQLTASIANERRRVDRYRDLKTRDVMPQERLDDAEAQLAVYQASMAAAQARLAIVEDRLRKALLLSPVNGVVERRHVSVGDFAKVGQPMLMLTDTEALRAELPFPETVGEQIRLGQELALESPLAPGLVVQASVDHIRPQVGSMSRALVVIAEVKNPGPWRPQATVEATALVEQRSDAVVVPLLAVVKRPSGDVVYLLQDGEPPTVRQQPVEVGARQDGWIEIISGVEPGVSVIAEGAHYLSDGAQVAVSRGQP
jgi:membrane fusion protein (multidrug efflux system)